MKVWGFLPKNPTYKPAEYLLYDSIAALVRHSQAQNIFRSTLNLCMPSDKPNSITTKAMYGLDFFTVQRHFISRHAFSPVSMLASWFYQSLPLFSIPFSTRA